MASAGWYFSFIALERMLFQIVIVLTCSGRRWTPERSKVKMEPIGPAAQGTESALAKAKVKSGKTAPLKAQAGLL
jgi:hypothetical protein